MKLKIREIFLLQTLFSNHSETCIKTQSSSAEEDILQLLRFLPLAKMDNIAQADVNSDMTLQEVIVAIKEFLSGKSPGPDGRGIDFYTAFVDDTAPLSPRMFKESIKKNKLLNSLRAADVCLILKKIKTKPTRPHIDLSLFSVTILKCLRRMATIKLLDQVGFIPRRLSFLNVCRLLNIVQSKQTKSKSAILDANTAFHQVDWKYMLLTVREFDLSDNFGSWVEMLSAHLTGWVPTNSDESHPFNLYRGVWPSCPLSHLLFAVY